MGEGRGVPNGETAGAKAQTEFQDWGVGAGVKGGRSCGMGVGEPAG